MKYKFFVKDLENTLTKHLLFLRIVSDGLKIFSPNRKKVANSILGGNAKDL